MLRANLPKQSVGPRRKSIAIRRLTPTQVNPKSESGSGSRKVSHAFSYSSTAYLLGEGPWRFMTANMADGDWGAHVLRLTLRDFIISVIFWLAMFHHSYRFIDGIRHIQHSNFENQFIKKTFMYQHGNYKRSITFEEVRTAREFWTYINDVVVPNLYDSEFVEIDPDLINGEEKRAMLLHNFLIGVPRFRQLRVKNGTCTIFPMLLSIFQECYQALNNDRFKNTETFGEGPPFVYHNSTKSPIYYGLEGVYTDGGYKVELKETKLQTTVILDVLKERQWISKATRFVSLDFSYYNGNFDSFCLCGLQFEFPRAGGIKPSYYFESLRIFDIYEYDYIHHHIVNTVILLILLYFCFEEIIEFAHIKARYFVIFWSYHDVSHIVICFTAFYHMMSFRFNVTSMPATVPGKYTNYEIVRYYYCRYRNWFGMAVFLSYIKIIKYLGINKTMRQLKQTLRNCAVDLICYMIVFLVVLISFAEVAYLLFGPRVEDFKSLHGSFFALMMTVIGNIDYHEIKADHPYLAPIFFVFYIFFVFFVILNMYMAIINESFADVKTEFAVAPDDLEMMGYIKKVCHKWVNCLKLRDKIKMAASWKLKFDKIEDLLFDCGYNVAEIGYFLSHYQTERTTDAINMRKLRNDVMAKLRNPRQSAETYPTGVTAGDFFHHQERIEAIEQSLESLVEEVNILVKRLERLRYVQKRPRLIS